MQGLLIAVWLLVNVLVTNCIVTGEFKKGWLSYMESWDEVEAELDENRSILTDEIPSSFRLNLRELPEAERANLVRFYLYTDYKSRFAPYEILYDNAESLAASPFDKSLPVKFLIHGFGRNWNCSFPQLVKDGYLLNGYKYNLILVDWGALSMNADSNDPVIALVNYKAAVDNTKIVGKRVGEFISFLFQSRYTKMNMVHIVGWSLGAHVSGYAGENVFQTWFVKVGRVTALDPAGPLFYTDRIGRHVSERDADFVDFILTDMGQSGTMRPLGHANFFVNGGSPPQPGCLKRYKSDGFAVSIPSMVLGSCSHGRAPKFYLDSILMTKPYLQARKCFGYMAYLTGLCAFRTLSTVGEYCQPGTEGHYYIDVVPQEVNSIYSC